MVFDAEVQSPATSVQSNDKGPYVFATLVEVDTGEEFQIYGYPRQDQYQALGMLEEGEIVSCQENDKGYAELHPDEIDWLIHDSGRENPGFPESKDEMGGSGNRRSRKKRSGGRSRKRSRRGSKSRGRGRSSKSSHKKRSSGNIEQQVDRASELWERIYRHMRHDPNVDGVPSEDAAAVAASHVLRAVLGK